MCVELVLCFIFGLLLLLEDAKRVIIYNTGHYIKHKLKAVFEMSLRHSQIAWVAAHVPTRLIYDPEQTAVYGTPLNLEEQFAETAEHIRENYISQINVNFGEIWETCQIKVKKGNYTGSWPYSDVISVRPLNEYNSVDIRHISVRPCFEGYGMFTITVYQMLKIAYALNKPYVYVRDCLPKTVAIMKYNFQRYGILQIDQKREEKGVHYPDCRLYTLEKRLTAADLGIAHKIIELKSKSLIQLNPDAFPTAAELNDDDYVETHFHPKLF